MSDRLTNLDSKAEWLAKEMIRDELKQSNSRITFEHVWETEKEVWLCNARCAIRLLCPSEYK